MNEQQFKDRTKSTALRIIRLVESLPKTRTADILGRQLLRSGVSVGANYRAACRGKSPADMIAKLAIVEEEADESLYWMELLVESGLIANTRLIALTAEMNQIVAMIVASQKTLRRRLPKSKIENKLTKGPKAMHASFLRRQILPLVLGACFLSAPFVVADDDGFKPIFNGRSLEGWDGNPKLWSVADGTIVGKTTADNPTKGNTFLIWRQAPVDDFVLRLSYKIVGGNSGIQYRSKEIDKWVVGGYQGDFEAGDTFSGILYEERGRGILANRGQKVTIGSDGKKSVEQVADSKSLQAGIKKEDWNEYEIIAQGNHLIHKINGQVTAEVIDNQSDKRAASGILALQLHAGPPMTVQFKDVRLKRTRLAEGNKKIVMVAGTPSHGKGAHEFNAGTMLLKKCLDATPGIVAVAYYNGWPADPTAFDNADSILLYMDGGGGHPVIQRNRLAEIDQLMKRGVGLCCAHYAVEVPKEKGGPDLTRWIGGYYETGYSINPHWDARFTDLPRHPITSGVRPFTINDEWYYNIRFPEGLSGIEPLLKAAPPDATRRTAASKANPGRVEIVAWAVERPDGGRGFGFTGGHNHINWGNDDFRKLVLNALLWTAKADVPPGGVASSVSPEELTRNLDPKR